MSCRHSAPLKFRPQQLSANTKRRDVSMSQQQRTPVCINLQRQAEPFWFESHDLSCYLTAVKLKGACRTLSVHTSPNPNLSVPLPGSFANGTTIPLAVLPEELSIPPIHSSLPPPSQRPFPEDRTHTTFIFPLFFCFSVLWEDF